MAAMYGSVVRSTHDTHILEPVAATTKVCSPSRHKLLRDSPKKSRSIKRRFETSRVVNSRSRARLWLVAHRLWISFVEKPCSPLGVAMPILFVRVWHEAPGWRLPNQDFSSSKLFKSASHSGEYVRKWINLQDGEFPPAHTFSYVSIIARLEKSFRSF